MKPHSSARFILSLLIGVGVLQTAAAQPPNTTAAGPRALLSAEEIVNNLIQKNLARAQALGAYQGARTYRLDYRGFPGSRSAEMVVDMKYQSPAMKEFTIRSATGSSLLIEKVFKKLLQSEKEALTKENQSRVALNYDNY